MLPQETPFVDATLQPLNTDAVAFNKHSLKELDKVLDQIELDPKWRAKLEEIINES